MAHESVIPLIKERIGHLNKEIKKVRDQIADLIDQSPMLCKIGHMRLRKALYMPALVSIQCNPVMIAFYDRLRERGNAVARVRGCKTSER